MAFGRIILAVLFFNSTAVDCFAAHGVTLNGEMKYGPDFTRFEYT